MVLATGVDDVRSLSWSENESGGKSGVLSAVSVGSTGPRVTRVAVDGPSPARRLLGRPDDALVSAGRSPARVLLLTQSAGLAAGVALSGPPPVLYGPEPATMASTAQLWDVASGALVGEVDLPGGHVATGWSTLGIESASSVRVAAPGTVYTVTDPGSGEVVWSAPGIVYAAFTPDASMVATSDFDGNVQLVDLAAGAVIGSPMQLDPSPVSVGFDDDGHLVVWNTAQPGLSIVPISVEAWIDTACTIAGRNLTIAEWEFHLPGRPYESTCPQWPPGQ